MKRCPQWQDAERQVKAGRTSAGSQRYRCKGCGHKDTPELKARGYPPETRARAIRQ